MALPARLKTLDEVGEKYRDQYKAHAGTDGESDGFILDVIRTDNWALEDVHGLRSGLSKEKASGASARKELKDMKALAEEHDTDLQSFPDMIREAYAKASDPGKKVDTDAALVAEKDRHAAEVTKLKAENATLKSGFEVSQVESTITAEVAKAKGSHDLLMPILREKLKAITGDDGKTRVVPVDKHGNARLTEKSGETSDMSIGEFIQTLKDDNRYAAAFAGNGVSGTGTTTAGAGRSTGSSTFESVPESDGAGRMMAASREMKARQGK